MLVLILIVSMYWEHLVFYSTTSFKSMLEIEWRRWGKLLESAATRRKDTHWKQAGDGCRCRIVTPVFSTRLDARLLDASLSERYWDAKVHLTNPLNFYIGISWYKWCKEEGKYCVRNNCNIIKAQNVYFQKSPYQQIYGRWWKYCNLTKLSGLSCTTPAI